MIIKQFMNKWMRCNSKFIFIWFDYFSRGTYTSVLHFLLAAQRTTIILSDWEAHFLCHSLCSYCLQIEVRGTQERAGRQKRSRSPCCWEAVLGQQGGCTVFPLLTAACWNSSQALPTQYCRRNSEYQRCFLWSSCCFLHKFLSTQILPLYKI